MKAKLRDGRLFVSVLLQEPRLSKSGKSLVVASSRGPWQSAVLVEGKTVYVNLNAFIYPDSHEPSIQRHRTKHKDGQTNQEENLRKSERGRHEKVRTT